MRNYCRAFHTSMEYLTSMSMGSLLAELGDAIDELKEEQAEQDRQMRKYQNSMRRKGR